MHVCVHVHAHIKLIQAEGRTVALGNEGAGELDAVKLYKGPVILGKSVLGC